MPFMPEGRSVPGGIGKSGNREIETQKPESPNLNFLIQHIHSEFGIFKKTRATQRVAFLLGE
jgi:hypothetical protein